MADDELDALPGALAFVAEQLTAPVSGMHDVISQRVFRFTGPPGRLVQQVHDTIAGGVYHSIPRGARVVGAAARALARPKLRGPTPISDSSIGARSQAILNAIWGDRMAERGNALATEPSFRRNGRRLDPVGLAAELRVPDPHVVILIHGLGQTEACWEGPERLVADLDADRRVLPVSVRYNTGLSVAQTGDEIGLLIRNLWSAADRRPSFSLVGFSLGGLVARAAYTAAIRGGMPAADSFRHIITIGSPHAGSHLARLARLASLGLGIARTTRSLSAFMESRSVALKELGWARGMAVLPHPTAVQHHFVAATVTADRNHPIGALVGDLVVRVSSATAPAIVADNVRVHGGTRHLDLISDPGVRSQILEWLHGPAT